MKAGVAGASLALAASMLAAGDWPQWRGPDRDGSLPVGSCGGGADGAVLLWEREVGEGYSGPVVSGDRVFCHSRRGGREVVSGLRLETGELLWSRTYDAPFEQDPSGQAHGRGPYSTPVLADGRLFTLGVTSILLAWDAGTGRLLWRADYSTELEPSYPDFGAAASPLVWEGLCFAPFGTVEGRRPGGSGHGFMAALRVQDGTEVWRWDGDAPALAASPVIRRIAGTWQLVFKSKQHIVGVDARAGRELWRLPFPVPMHNTIVTPLFVGERLLTSDYEIGVRAWHIGRAGDGWAVRELWRHREASLFTSSPVVVGEQVVGFSHLRRGQLFGLDPTDGAVRWRGAPRSGEHASLIVCGDTLLALQHDGWLVAGRVTSDGLQVTRRHRVGGPGTWGHPAVLGDRVVIRDGSRLAVYRIAGP